MYPAGEKGIGVRRVPIHPEISVRVLESGPRDGFPVILVHGWAGSVYSFAETIPSLAAAGNRVIAIDLPGHGGSDKPPGPMHYDVIAMAHAVLKVLQALEVHRYAIVAHSMAGAIALHLAAYTSGPIGIVFIAAVGVGRVPLAPVLRVFTPGIIINFLSALITRPVARFVAGIAFGTPGRPTDRDVDEYWAPSQDHLWVPAMIACLHRANWHREPAEFLRHFTLPTLVIAGARDLIVWGVAHGGRYIPGARVVEVQGAGHLVMQECAAAVNPEILNFLESLGS